MTSLPRAVVADADVVVSALIGGRARQVLASPSGPTCIAASVVADEVLEHLRGIAERRGLDPTLVIQTLNDQGLAFCYDEFSCTWGHPLVYGLLLEFLPPPQGVDPVQFYPYLADYAAQIDMIKWNGGAEFSAGVLGRIIEPGLHALDLLDTWPYLTRMYTTISPSEMMEDPIFHLNPDLDEVPQLRQADNYNLCNGDSVTTLPPSDP